MCSKKFFIITILTIPFCAVHAALSVVEIEPFNRHRDQDAVTKILSQEARAAAYCPIRFAIDRARKNVITEVIRMDNKTIAIIQHRTQRAYDWSLDYKKYGYIRLLAVDKDYRNKGYGKQLLEHAVKRMEESDVSYIYLVTQKKNSAARKLYQSAQFSSDQHQIPFFTPSSFMPDLWFIPGCEQKELLYYKNYESTGEKRQQINQKKCVLFTLTVGFTMLMTYIAHINLVKNSQHNRA